MKTIYEIKQNVKAVAFDSSATQHDYMEVFQSSRDTAAHMEECHGWDIPEFNEYVGITSEFKDKFLNKR